MCKLGERKVPRVFSDFTLSQVPICLAPFVGTFSVLGVVPSPLVSANLLDSSDAPKNVCFGYIYPLDDGGSDGYPRCICNYYVYYISVCYMYYISVYCHCSYYSGTPDAYSGGSHCVYIHLYVHYLYYNFCETLGHPTPMSFHIIYVSVFTLIPPLIYFVP